MIEISPVVEALIRGVDAFSSSEGNGKGTGTGNRVNKDALLPGGRATYPASLEELNPSCGAGNEADKAENGQAAEEGQLLAVAPAEWLSPLPFCRQPDSISTLMTKTKTMMTTTTMKWLGLISPGGEKEPTEPVDPMVLTDPMEQVEPTEPIQARVWALLEELWSRRRIRWIVLLDCSWDSIVPKDAWDWPMDSSLDWSLH